ncbi:isoprenylcysteine carboxyl methyltransferase family protein [Bacillus badius]|uniref:Alkylpyrone O-methyltransferase n=1 Tax=Bacillus badius TaxID=1455 RepID=A0ABR5AZS4_BACBA|nr:isoprenylcysteine carboxylmethyltransferase family protein [Bacillus badius]KIL80252.1 Alkylpyrone O-methyltransferase [Bacillus badius]MED4716976.1 isoprenylcysteine carboxylmethyltransferase family protein [Bacillus badius]
MSLFFLVFTFVVLQRLLEVIYARSNEKRMRAQGAIEFGAEHYKWIVLLHVLFFVSLLAEVFYIGMDLAPGWQWFFAGFLIAQLLRVWSLASLGPFWNTKILVLPGASKVKRGPYRWIPHPNYVVVAMEIASLPLIFGAWRTALIFSVANALLLLFIRIPAEEKALERLESQ